MKYLFKTLKKQTMNWSWFAVVGVGVLAFLVIGMLANAQNNSGRHIRLLPQAGELFDVAAGRLFIQLQSPLNEFIEYTVHNLRPQTGSQAYAIYVSTLSLGRSRLQTFNTRAANWQYSSFTVVPDAGNPLWESETVIVEVYIEADDGFHAPDVGGLLVLRGVDQP